MSEIDVFIVAFGAGIAGGMLVALALFGHMKNLYDQKIMTLRIQMIGLRALVGVGDDHNDE